MIELGLPFAARIARHYQGRGEPFEDLVQVATVGLIKAVDGYEPMDASGAAALVAGLRSARRRGAGFALEQVRRPVHDVLVHAGLGPLFGLAPVPRHPEPAGRVAHTTLP